MIYIIERYDGWFVADQRLTTQRGSSYTEKLQHAKRFASEAEAERDCCADNERVRRYEDAGR